MAAPLYRDPNTGAMVPLIGMTLAQADARYAQSSGQALTGNVVVNTPTLPGHVARKDYVDAALALPAGVVMPFAATVIPAGWPFLLCQGQAVSRTTYSALFTAISTIYGVGNGSTTFNLPDMRGRTPASVWSGDAEFNAVGKKLGVKTVTLSKANMPNNSTGTLTMHNSAGPTILNNATGDAISQGGGSSTLYHSHAVANTGAYSHGQTGFNLGFGNGAHNNLQPYSSLHFIIKF